MVRAQMVQGITYAVILGLARPFFHRQLSALAQVKLISFEFFLDSAIKYWENMTFTGLAI